MTSKLNLQAAANFFNLRLQCFSNSCAQVGGETEELAFYVMQLLFLHMSIGTTTVNFVCRPIYLTIELLNNGT